MIIRSLNLETVCGITSTLPENELPEEVPEDMPEEAVPKAEVNVNVNLDAEYFHWKEGGEPSGEKKPEKHSFFSRHHKE